MSIGDLTILEQASMSGRGSRLYNVAAGSTINPGEPVMFATANAVTVVAAGTNFPVASSDFFVGIAATTSTNTSATAGTVGVYPADPGMTFLANPTVATSWDTQVEYDALVNKNVVLDLASGAYTVLATNPSVTTNGLLVQAMNIKEHPGKVALACKVSATSTR